MALKKRASWRLSRWLYFGLLGAGMIVAHFQPLLPPFPLCLFKLTTGYPCAGCGMTRSLVAAAHGQFAEAFSWHPLGLALFLGAWGLVFPFAYELWKGQPLPWENWLRRWGLLGAWLLFSAFLFVWLLRLSYIRWGFWLPIPLKTNL